MRYSDITKQYNNLGLPISSTGQGLQNFWNWFGKSKIVDTKGQPLVVYHGTISNFSSFDPTKSKNQSGIPIDYNPAYFFSLSSDTAQSYANQTTEPWSWRSDDDADEHLRLMQAGEYEKASHLSKIARVKNVKKWGNNANVMPVYLRMLKPMRVSGKGLYWDEIPYDGDFISTRDVCEIALSKGYDGLIIKNVHDRGEGHGKPSTILVAFSPNQIKSAIGNKGSFDPSTGNITESL